MYEVVWYERPLYECGDETRLGLFATEPEAEAFAARFSPWEESTGSTRVGVSVRLIECGGDVGPSAKWNILKYRDDDGWQRDIHPICPTGEERLDDFLAPDWWESLIYAPTRAAAIARFEAHHGIRFEEET